MKVRFSLEPGTYGLALLDDENSDSEMNFSFIGLPKEGFGFSDYYHTTPTRPQFKDFSFILNKEQNKRIQCKIKYM